MPYGNFLFLSVAHVAQMVNRIRATKSPQPLTVLRIEELLKGNQLKGRAFLTPIFLFLPFNFP